MRILFCSHIEILSALQFNNIIISSSSSVVGLEERTCDISIVSIFANSTSCICRTQFPAGRHIFFSFSIYRGVTIYNNTIPTRLPPLLFTYLHIVLLLYKYTNKREYSRVCPTRHHHHHVMPFPRRTQTAAESCDAKSRPHKITNNNNNLLQYTCDVTIYIYIIYSWYIILLY